MATKPDKGFRLVFMGRDDYLNKIDDICSSCTKLNHMQNEEDEIAALGEATYE